MDDTTPNKLTLQFTASGSEYFRIWTINLLLTVVTLGFYMPFAKVRRLRYFYANTLVGGQPLAFHGDPWKMLRGYVLMLVLFGGYALAGHFSPWLALGVFVLLALLWPALWRSSLRFRMHNTSWRGLRFGFAGSVADAYKALLPLFVPSLVFLAANAWFLSDVDKEDEAAVNAAMLAQGPWLLMGFGLLAVLTPLCLSLIKRYQHGGYRYAGQQGEFNAGARPFYMLVLKALGLMLLAFMAMGLLLGLAFWVFGAAFKPQGLAGGLVFGGVSLIAYVGVWSLLGAYFGARMQNLVWNATRSQSLIFSSRLRVRPLAALTCKNLLLMVVTLGVYRPFAVVNTTALRLQAVHIELQGDIDTWQAAGAQRTDATTSEMAGDFFGIDVGL